MIDNLIMICFWYAVIVYPLNYIWKRFIYPDLANRREWEQWAATATRNIIQETANGKDSEGDSGQRIHLTGGRPTFKRHITKGTGSNKCRKGARPSSLIKELLSEPR